MSPTSSRTRAGGSRRADRRYGKFQRALVASFVLFSLVAASALIAYALQGPRLRDTNFDVLRAVNTPGTALRLYADRPLDPEALPTVSVEPAAATRVTVEGSQLTVVFLEALRYDETYRLTITDVREGGRSLSSTWAHEIRTPAARLLFLDRGDPGEDDRIFRVGMDGVPPEEVYRAPRIAAFTPVGSLLVVATEESSGQVSLGLVEPVTGRREDLVLPANTTVVDLVAPATGTTVALTLSSTTPEGPYDRTLFTVDTAVGRQLVEVRDLTGSPVRATKTLVVPGRSEVIAWVDDISVVRVDLQSGLSVPIVATADQVWSVSSDGDEAVIVDVGGTVAINTQTLEQARFVASPIGGRDVFEGDTYRTAQGEWLQKVAIPNRNGTEFVSVFVADDGQGNSRILYRTPDDVGSIGRFVVSPNDHYIALEIVPNVRSERSDGRSLNERDRSVMTVVVDRETGSVVRSVDGFWPVW